MNCKELKTLVQAAKARQEIYAASFKDSSNPQIRDSYHNIRGRVQVLDAILQAIDAPRPAAAHTLNIFAHGLT
jgi:hypothetical protein